MAKEEKKGFFTRLKEGLAKTRANITDNMDMVFASYDKVTDEFLEELEETMIMGDIGVKTTEELLDHLRRQVKEEKIGCQLQESGQKGPDRFRGYLPRGRQ